MPMDPLPITPWVPKKLELPEPESTKEEFGLITPRETPEPLNSSPIPPSPPIRPAPEISQRRSRNTVDPSLIIEGKRTRKPRNLAAALLSAVDTNSRISTFHTLQEDIPAEPTTWRGLQQHPFREKFIEAEKAEISKLSHMKTFVEVPEAEAVTNKHRILDLKWVYKYKFEGQALVGFKARICVRGDQQEENGADTYAATLASRTYRVLLAIANKWFMVILQFDAISAFTNSDLDELVYTKMPPGYRKEGVIWKLQKALYGLRRSPLLWYRLLRTALEKLGLHTLREDSCVLTNSRIIVFFYIDNINIIFHPRDRAEAKKLIKNLKSSF